MPEYAEKADIARLDGRIDGVILRVTGTESWVTESRRFHVEMRQNWDQLIGAQKAEEKIQAERHAENTAKSDRINIKLTIIGLVLVLLGLLCSGCMVYLAARAAQHSQADPAKIFHSHSAQPRYNASVAPPQNAAGGEYVRTP